MLVGQKLKTEILRWRFPDAPQMMTMSAGKSTGAAVTY
jgi:hypothetical protein